MPRYRQKLAFPPVQSGRPFWIDDSTFNLEYHVRHSALPSPGSEEQLRNIAGRLFAQQLDRSKPLWEIWLVQGLEKNRFATIIKTHHSVIDGVAGVDISTVLFDLKPIPEPIEPDHEWVPQPPPSSAEMLARTAQDVSGAPWKLTKRLSSAATRPVSSARQVAESAEGIGEILWGMADPAPEVPLNVEIGSHRRYAWVRCRLDDFKRIKGALGGTVNDVVLAAVSGALRRWLEHRGLRPEGLELRALVPVSIRADDEHHQGGNRIAAMRGPLPVYVEDPVKRLEVVKEEMGELKESKQALGAEVISRINDFAPPTLLAQASRINFSTRLFNLIVTNVPGPAAAAVRARTRARGRLPGRLPAREPRARDRDHELQRRHQLRAARRLRHDGGRRGDRGGDLRVDRRADRRRQGRRGVRQHRHRGLTRVTESGESGAASRLPAASTAVE